jgi:hypothetical protein
MEFVILFLIIFLSIFSIIKKFCKELKIENKCDKCSLKNKHKIKF